MNMKKVSIIAEIGVNHNGDIDLAHQMIDQAAACGVDYVKFQTFTSEKLASVVAPKADYQINNTNTSGSQFEMLKKLELDVDAHYILQEYCKNKGVTFLSSAFDLKSLELLHKMDLPIFKIPSGEITNYPYLKGIAKFKKPVILSTGMATLEEIEATVGVLLENGLNHKSVTLLHCNTEYPTPFEDVNLFAMQKLADTFKMPVGYSDHTKGSEVAIAAVALGAQVIEKHFTIDQNLPGPDQKASMEPREFKRMVESIRNIEKAISGSGEKTPSKSETKNIVVARKSLHLTANLEAGTKIEEKHLIALRPAGGISPMQWNKVIGRTINKALKQGHQLKLEDLSV